MDEIDEQNKEDLCKEDINEPISEKINNEDKYFEETPFEFADRKDEQTVHKADTSKKANEKCTAEESTNVEQAETQVETTEIINEYNGDQTVEHNETNKDTANTDLAFVDIRDKQNNDDSELSKNADAKSEKENEEFDALAITICNVCYPIPLQIINIEDSESEKEEFDFGGDTDNEEKYDPKKDVDYKGVFPIRFSRHFYVICFDLQSGSFVLIENNCVENDSADRDLGITKALHSVFVDFLQSIEHRSYKKLRRAKLEVVKLEFKKRNDHADCGIIVVTAMDCYMGKVKKLKDMFLEGIPYTQLVNLRQMIATKIMMSKINIRKNVYQRRIKSNSKKKNIDSFVCDDYDDSIDEVDPNINVKEVVKDINKSSAEYTEDNSNDEDNEESHSAEEEQNTEDSDLVKTPTVKKRSRPKKIVRDNENKTSSVKRRGRPRKSNDESKKQTIDNLDTKTNVLSLTDNFILVNSQSVHDILGIPMGGWSLESLESRSPDDPFIKEWFSQFRDKNEVRPNDITDIIVSTNDDYIKMIKEKCYNIHQDLLSVREKLDEGLSRFPDCKKLNMFREKFEETTTGIDNDDTAGIEMESDSHDCQIESDSLVSDDDNQKSDFQVIFHKESGNSDLQRIKNKECNEEVHHILNEDDKVNDSCPAAGVCSDIEEDEVKSNDKVDDSCPAPGVCSVIEEDEVKLIKFIENDNVLVDDVPKKKYSLNECDAVIQDENKAVVQDSVERSEHTLKKEKNKISNEELRSESLQGNVGAEDVVDSQETIEDNFKQDEQIQSAEDVGCSIPDLDDDKLDVYNGPDLHVGCSIPDLDDDKLDVYNGPDLRSPYEYLPVDVKKPVSNVEKIVADTLFAMIGSKLEKFMKLVQVFEQKTEEERKKTIDDAIANRDHREEI
nr:hypothetical protein [Tanacetum cinerariifolium]